MEKKVKRTTLVSVLVFCFTDILIIFVCFSNRFDILRLNQ